MNQTIGVFVAWPYANGDLHLGHVAGVYLPADIFARYHRLRGNRVIMVSGSDSHGTPITVSAEQQGVSPREFFTRYHRRFLDGFQRLGISFDLFTHTDTANHATVSQEIVRVLYERGYIFPRTQAQLYCETDQRFLPDRYVEGTCPYCGYTSARGDQCDNCGRTLDATELIEPRCKLCGNRPVVRETNHLFFDLPAFEQPLLDWLGQQDRWRPNVRHFVRNYLQGGLKPRALSRDLDWGIPMPIPGYEDKVIYVWFEAVVGYLSASIELAKLRGTSESWQAWWRDPAAQDSYFLGKDNIPFHAIIWPAELLGYDDGLNLPYDIPASEFLNLEGRQFSTSRDWAVWLPDFLDRYDPDPLRYYLTVVAPETGDSEFTWAGFVERNNNELVAAWGNLVNRVVSFAVRHWEGQVPAPGPLDDEDRALLDRIAAGFGPIGDLYAGTEFKAALRETMALVREVNRYLDVKAPWFAIKENREAAGTAIYVALQAIDSLATLLAPVLPHTSAEVKRRLGQEQPLIGDLTIERVAEAGMEGGDEHDVLIYHPIPQEASLDRWQPSTLQPGTPITRPQVLFPKLDESVAEEERKRLEERATPTP